ncbi:MAG: PilW family protein [Leptothrix sp. (in: b-proteobacteria)]
MHPMRGMDRHSHPAAATARLTQRGFSLIELMVGMAIGLLATLVITQVALVYEGQKRTTTSGSDGQVNGALALQTLQRDIQASGYGLASGGIASCTEIHGKRTGMTDIKKWIMAPVLIKDGLNGEPDTIQVLMSSQSGFALPMRVFDQHALGDTRFGLNDGVNLGNRVGDLMLAVPPAGSTDHCSLFSISAIPTTSKVINGAAATVTDRFIEHTAGTDPSQAWNQDAVLGTTVFPGTSNAYISYPTGSHLVNLGKLIDRTYSVSDKHVLEMKSFDSASGVESATELFPNIASLQAVYGKDTSATADHVVDTWNATQPTSADEWSRVLALRIAVVVRSAQPEKDQVTLTAPVWHPDGVTETAIPVDKNIDNGVVTWKNYRYKVFETVVPLRNMLWQS